MTAPWRVRRWAEMNAGERTQLRAYRSLAACSIRSLACMREGGLALARHEVPAHAAGLETRRL